MEKTTYLCPCGCGEMVRDYYVTEHHGILSDVHIHEDGTAIVMPLPPVDDGTRCPRCHETWDYCMC